MVATSVVNLGPWSLSLWRPHGGAGTLPPGWQRGSRLPVLGALPTAAGDAVDAQTPVHGVRSCAAVGCAAGDFTAHPERAGVKCRAAGRTCPAGPVIGSRGVFGCIL